MLVSALRVLNRSYDTKIEQYAALMANTTSDDHEENSDKFFASALFADAEDLAYLQLSREVNALRLGPLGIRIVNRKFRTALSKLPLSRSEIDLQLAQFQVYYWSMTICLSNGKYRKHAYKKLRKSWYVVNELTHQMSMNPVMSK